MSRQRDTKSCPMCAEDILAAAIKCKHCLSVLDTSALDQPAPSERSPRRAKRRRGKQPRPDSFGDRVRSHAARLSRAGSKDDVVNTARMAGLASGWLGREAAAIGVALASVWGRALLIVVPLALLTAAALYHSADDPRSAPSGPRKRTAKALVSALGYADINLDEPEYRKLVRELRDRGREAIAAGAVATLTGHATEVGPWSSNSWRREAREALAELRALDPSKVDAIVDHVLGSNWEWTMTEPGSPDAHVYRQLKLALDR